MLGYPITKTSYILAYKELRLAIKYTPFQYLEKSVFITNSYSNIKSMLSTVLIDEPLQSVCSVSCPCPTLHGNFKTSPCP